MIPSLVANSSSNARGSAHSILFYPVSLEVTCPFTPHLFAVPSAMDVGTGSIITKAGFGFSFVLKIFEIDPQKYGKVPSTLPGLSKGL